jgi:hypothetical protein
MANKYYIHPTSKEIFSYTDDTSIEDIRRFNPTLFTHEGTLEEIKEEDIDSYLDPDGTSRLNSILVTLIGEINYGFETAVSCGKCMKDHELKYHTYERRNSHYESQYDPTDTTQYPYQEEQTFQQQYKEAIAYKNSGYTNKSLCPNIVTMASNRGKDLNYIVDKIIEKKETKDRRLFKALGLKQKYIDIIDSARSDLQTLQHLYDTRATWILF